MEDKVYFCSKCGSRISVSTHTLNHGKCADCWMDDYMLEQSNNGNGGNGE